MKKRHLECLWAGLASVTLNLISISIFHSSPTDMERNLAQKSTMGQGLHLSLGPYAPRFILILIDMTLLWVPYSYGSTEYGQFSRMMRDSQCLDVQTDGQLSLNKNGSHIEMRRPRAETTRPGRLPCLIPMPMPLDLYRVDVGDVGDARSATTFQGIR